MASLDYSVEASNVINRFLGVEVVVYVEGDEDVPFWELMFETFSEVTVRARSVGGKPELEKYAAAVLDDRLHSIVAMDLDFTDFGGRLVHPNILNTFAHSVENSMIQPNTIRDVIRSIGRIPRREITVDQCREWLDAFAEVVEELVIYDVENWNKNHGVCVVGENCARFALRPHSAELCPMKVSAYIGGIGFSVSEQDGASIAKAISDNYTGVIDMVRGHFLFSAALRFVTSVIKRYRDRVHVSHESLFGALMLSFEAHFDRDHPHFLHYKNQISGVSIP